MANQPRPSNAAPAKPSSDGKRALIIVTVVLGVLAALGVGIFFMIVGILEKSDAYRLGMEKLRSSSEAMALLGPPVKSGSPSGSIQTSGATGEAQLAIPVEGQKARGVLYVEAKKDMGKWVLGRIVLDLEGLEQRIDLNRRGTAI